MKEFDNEYEPFGDEWEAHVMRMRKDDIVRIFSMVGKEKDVLSKLLKDAKEAMTAIMAGRRKGDKERYYWLEVDIEDDIHVEETLSKINKLFEE